MTNKTLNSSFSNPVIYFKNQAECIAAKHLCIMENDMHVQNVGYTSQYFLNGYEYQSFFYFDCGLGFVKLYCEDDGTYRIETIIPLRAESIPYNPIMSNFASVFFLMDTVVFNMECNAWLR